MKKVNIAYLAGLFDGEGWLAVSVSECPTKLSVDVTIGMAMKAKDCWINKVNEIMKNDLNIEREVKITNGYGYLHIYSKDNIYKFLNILLPYLTVKKDLSIFILNRFPRLRKKACHSGHGKFNRYVYWDRVEEFANFITDSQKFLSRKSERLKWTPQAIRDFYQHLVDDCGYEKISHDINTQTHEWSKTHHTKYIKV